jgi:hypothetical protein
MPIQSWVWKICIVAPIEVGTRAARRENVRFKKLVSAIFTILGLGQVAAHRARGV